MANIQATFLLLCLLLLNAKADQLEKSTNISLGYSIFPNTSLVSPSGLFAFGFYRQGNGYAIGIWLATKPKITVVWTANRNDPPVSSNSRIEFTNDGQLLLRTEQGEEKPIPDDYLEVQGATSACLFDSGNFVIYNKSLVMWQSFDYPTDTILGGQNLSYFHRLISSASASDRSMGRFYLSFESDGNLVAYPLNSSGGVYDAYWASNTSSEEYLDDAWLNLNRTGYLCVYHLLSFDDGNILTITLANSSSNSYPPADGTYKSMVIYRATLDPDGNFRLYAHRFKAAIDNSSTVVLINEWSAFQDQCTAKGLCGVNSFCSSTANLTNCSCFPGFVFVNPNQKYRGCYRTFIDEGSCRTIEPAVSYNITALQNMDWGGYPYSVLSSISDEEYCGRSCLEDCNCWAALYVNGTCSKHKLPLIYGKLTTTKSATAFIKMSFQTTQSALVPRSSPTVTSPKVVVESKKTLVLTLAVSFGSLAFLCSLIAVSSFFFYRRRAHRYQKLSDQNAKLGLNGGEFTLRSFSYNELENATDGFKEVLGRNSLGTVYKGAICEGSKIVTVKRLERVVEGEREFRAEMATIGQTHHRNLVQLIGFCVEGAKKLLVYEFMNNGSLADLLFKIDQRPSWKDRARIALDVARGILYLHEECEVRIIHCNIKPQNILLDESWTAKISDFGLAKLLRPNQTGTLTWVRGARGYLAPEWHKNTFLSEKVDVYSFGVVLLEIICCRSNMEVNVSTADEVLLTTWVYDCFVAKELKRLIGDEEVDMRNLERMVRVGLFCIQDDPNLRPSMKNVILMLEGTMDIAVPPSPIISLVSGH